MKHDLEKDEGCPGDPDDGAKSESPEREARILVKRGVDKALRGKDPEFVRVPTKAYLRKIFDRHFDRLLEEQ